MAEMKTYTLYGGGIEMVVTNLGGRVMSLLVEDRDGNVDDIVTGFDTPEKYLKDNPERFFGAVCGRYANRIAKGKFTIDGEEFSLAVNNGPNALHGGIVGFDSTVWDVLEVSESMIKFRYVSADGEEGYPGEVAMEVLYELTEDGEWVIEYEATTTKSTHINLTQHSYFNLRGESSTVVVEDQYLRINADYYLPVDDTCIPLGEPAPVEGTPFDFREAKLIGDGIDSDNEQVQIGRGWDHCWVLNGKEGAMKLAAVLTDPETGRRMECYTDQPGMQFYSSNWVDGSITSKDGEGKYICRGSLALEMQKFPDSPNKPQFPTTRLDPGERYTHRCIYKFDTVE